VTTAADTLSNVIAGVAKALAPLAEGLSSDAEVLATLADLGYAAPNAPPSLATLGGPVEGFVDALAAVEEKRQDLDAGNATEQDVLVAIGLLVAQVAAFIVQLHNLPNLLRNELPGPFNAATHLPDDIEQRLFEHFLIVSLENNVPAAGDVLFFLGFIEEEYQEADAPTFRTEHLHRTLRLDRLGKLFKDPLDLLKDVYGWGTPTINEDRLFEALRRLSVSLVSPAEFGYLTDAQRSMIAPAAPPPTDDDRESVIFIPILDAGGLRLSLAMVPVPKANAGELQGLAAFFTVSIGGAITIPISGRFAMVIEGEVDLSSGVAVVLRPDAPPNLATGADGMPVQLAGGKGGVRFAIGAPDEPTTLFSIPGGSRLQAKEISFGGGVLVSNGKPDVYLDARVEDGKFIVTMSEADGFLAKALPAEGVSFDFAFAVHWSQSAGLHFEGSGGIETTLALNIELGPIQLKELYVALLLAATGLTLEAALNAGLVIGPVSASVEKIGVKALLAFQPGNLGPVDLGFAFRPPTGLGIAVDAGPVSGGGFISFDPDNHRYAGILHLQILAISVTVIGLIETKLPDGRDGFSFLLIVCVEFSPIQLGYGFTLNGVGGLAGIHRGMNLDALRSGVYTGSLDHILFPKDPIANAPQLISDLSRIFPVAENRFTFGPMAKLGWGASIITVTLGIVIELPSPVRIALLGQIALTLPEAEDAVVDLHIDFVATLDFEAKLLALDATLRDSRIAAFTLTGDMAMRLSWGDQPNFAVAMGGFHPHFPTPPGFPALRRLQLALGAGDYIRLNCQTYQAVTSNSVQFGARLELFVEVGVTIHGWLGFDVLFILSPFSFVAEFTAGLEVKVSGVSVASATVDGALSGPNPWRVQGKAKISVLFFEATASVDEKFGEPTPAMLPVLDPWPDLLDAVKDSRNWAGATVVGVLPVVSLAAAKGDETVLIDPAGRITWLQHVAPLDRQLTKYKNSDVPAPITFTVDRATVGVAGSKPPTVDDLFPSGEFEQLTDAQKLSRPSFEKMHGGVQVSSAAVKGGASIPASIEFETRLVDSELDSRPGANYKLPQRVQLSHVRGGPSARSALGRGGQRAFEGDAKFVESAELFQVATTDDLSGRLDVTTPTTKGAALQALDQYLAAHPDERGALQVVPIAELAGV
jgi:hypothetical protein